MARGAHDVFPVVLVVLHLPPDQQSRARLELIQSLALPGVLDDLQGGGAGVVGDVDGVDFPGFVPGLLALHGENLPPDHQAAYIQGGLPQGGDFAPGHLAQHGLGRLWDDGGQQVLLVPHADLPAAGPLLQSLLILLHLPDLGLPLAADLLVAGLLHQGALSGVHREPARKLHRAGDLEPLLDKAFQLGAGVPGGQKLIAAVGQVDGELAALVDGLRLVEGAVKVASRSLRAATSRGTQSPENSSGGKWGSSFTPPRPKAGPSSTRSSLRSSLYSTSWGKRTPSRAERSARLTVICTSSPARSASEKLSPLSSF